MGIPEPDPNYATRTRPDPNKYGSGMGMHNMGRVENGLTRTRPDPTHLPGLQKNIFEDARKRLPNSVFRFDRTQTFLCIHLGFSCSRFTLTTVFQDTTAMEASTSAYCSFRAN